MNATNLQVRDDCSRVGFKGPRAAEWLTVQGVTLPEAPNTWTRDGSLLVARLGAGEFFLEGKAGEMTLGRIRSALEAHPAGVYPVLREDAAFSLSGAQVHEVLAQVCNVNFAALTLDSYPVIMTMMIGVAVLVVPQSLEAGRRYLIWCDPTFGAYVEDALGRIVGECGAGYTGVSA
jgi:sarcosine oxidase, subunit gamma